MTIQAYIKLDPNNDETMVRLVMTVKEASALAENIEPCEDPKCNASACVTARCLAKFVDQLSKG